MAEIIRGSYFSRRQEKAKEYCEETGLLAPCNIMRSEDDALHWVRTMNAYAKENGITWEPNEENDKKLEKIIRQEIGNPYKAYYFREPKH